MKTCKVCGREKVVDLFPLHSTTRDGRGPHCFSCLRQKAKEWYQKNKATRKVVARNRRLKSEYCISPDEYDSILKIQGGVCKICGKSPPDCGRLCVDHDHTTGRVRGILCVQCNSMIGMSRDTPSVLMSGAKYLESFSA